MVLKAGKRGVRSGNTLKASSSRHVRQYSKQACLSRQCIRNVDDATREFTNVLGEFDIGAENVPFSLNKKGRWLLPSKLKEKILHDHFREDDVEVQLIERHKITKHNNGVSFYSSTGNRNMPNGSKEIQKRSGYLDIENILNTKSSRKKWNSNRNRKRMSLPETETHLQSQIRYDVVYPCPISSSVPHNPKYIGYDNKRHCELNINCEGLSKRGKVQRHKFTRSIKDSLSYLDEYSDEEGEEEEGEDEEEQYEEDVQCEDEKRITRENMVILNDILRHTSKAQRLFYTESHANTCSGSLSSDMPRNEVNITYKTETTGTIHETEPNANSQQTVSAQQVTIGNVVATDPVCLILSNDDIDPFNLRQIYGRAYIECDCFPRKFIIDISTEVSSLECFTSFGINAAATTQALLLFTHDVENEINSLSDSVYKVTINMKLKLSATTIRIETLFDYTESTIPQVIQRVLFFIESLPCDILIKENANDTGAECTVDSALGECVDWKCKAYFPSDSYLCELFLSGVEHDDQAEALGFEVVSRMDSYTPDERADITSPKDRLCYVCYEEIGGGCPATALMACGHWFCDGCWREHLVSNVNAGATKLTCPEYDCSRTVDPGTMLTLVNVRQVIKHAKFCHDARVEQLELTKWCPAPNCGRVVEVSSTDVKIAQCGCKKKFCFVCLDDIHWPAPCEKLPEYKKKLCDSGDESIKPVEFMKPIQIYGKHCPHCKQYVEKDGGCNQIICVCGNVFCWGCGKEWDMCCHEMIQCESSATGCNNRHGTYLKAITVDEHVYTQRSQKWYTLAVSHRMQQHPAKVQKLKSAIPELSKTIITYARRSAFTTTPINLDFTVSGKEFSSISGKIKAFLADMVELYAEVNQIAEHIGVLLNSDTLPVDQHASMKAIAARLGAFGKFIYEVFTSGIKHNPKLALSKLTEIHRHSRHCVEGLVKCVEKIE